MNLSIAEVVKVVKGRFHGRIHPILGITTDTRSLHEGETFFALKGKNFDGHRFIPEAIRKKASYVVSEKPTPFPERTIQVQDTLHALGELARYYRSKLELKVVGITGSNGKTTTKEMTHAILSCKVPTHKSPASYNNLVGVPLTIFELKPRHQFAVIELGMNKIGEIARECEIILPDLGVLTNIAPVHIGFFGSIKNIAKAKAELLNWLDSDKAVLLNGDDPRVVRLSKFTQAKVYKFSVKNPSDYRATRVRLFKDRLEFSLKNTDFRVQALGIENVYNALAAIGVGELCGVSLNEMKDVLHEFQLPNLRATVHTHRGVTIINDSYNSNPWALKGALKWLELANGKRKIVVLGDMLELGKHSKKYHLQIGRLAKNRCDLLIGVGELAKYFKDGMQTKNAYYFSSKKKTVQFLKDLIKPGDIILIKGSRLMQMEEISDALLAFISA